jgi:hypothetical protein
MIFDNLNFKIFFFLKFIRNTVNYIKINKKEFKNPVPNIKAFKIK